MATLNEQIKSLHDQGFTFEQIAEYLDKETEAIKFAYQTAYGSVAEISDKLNDMRPVLINILFDIARDQESSTASRIKAAEVLLNNKGQMPEISAGILSNALRQMKAIKNKTSPGENPGQIPANVLDMATAVAS